MHIFWCDITPILDEPDPFIRWCNAKGHSLAPYLRLDDAMRHLTGLQLRSLAGAESRHSADSISVSHSGGLVVCARGSAPLGIDTEALCPSAAPLPLDSLTEPERQWVASQKQSLPAFLRLWTRQESLIKAEKSTLARMFSLPSLVENGVLVKQVGSVCFQELPILPDQYVTVLCAAPPIQTELFSLAFQQVFPL